MANNVLSAAGETLHRRTCKLMGNMFSIALVTGDAAWAEHCMDLAVQEIRRIESLFTTFRDDSQTQAINRQAGIRPVAVDREVFDVIARSIRISELTQGAFDITYGGVDRRLWNFDRSMTSLPDPSVARQSVRLINYRNIVLDEARVTVFLRHAGMRIGFGGIGKGYAADRAKQLLMLLGVHSGVVNAAGDLTVWGRQADGKPWTVGIADPDTKVPFSSLALADGAIATSGNYEKFVMIGGKRYSHTIDPKTGLPVTGVKSVSIISPMAELSDALATPVTVMGPRAGLNMIDQMKGVACIIIDDNNQLFTSKNISVH
ncbi:FAD:protein FMN transferase [Dawidia soli]|uniref:FAD:protein FMN transferase n=1 Tax=Dawidia soli TaxID=2782352 RepID=A0AAP2D7B0_9BACT|nr:FAD:protein FMN transferase [Dawidia soli]MBT1686447.1 FAD:protein FMN transferase [Dawidia soli]